MGIIRVTPSELRDIVKGSVEDKKMTGSGITMITSSVPVIGAGYHIEMKPGLHKVLLDSELIGNDIKAYYESMNKKLRNFAEPWQVEVSERLNIGMFKDLIALDSQDEMLNGLIVGAYAKMSDFKNFADIPTNERTLLIGCLRQLKSHVVTLTENGIYQENIFKVPEENGMREEQRPLINAVYDGRTGRANICSMLGDYVTKKDDVAEYRRRLHDTYAGLGNLINYYAGHQLYDTERYMDSDILDDMINRMR